MLATFLAPLFGGLHWSREAREGALASMIVGLVECMLLQLLRQVHCADANVPEHPWIHSISRRPNLSKPDDQKAFPEDPR